MSNGMFISYSSKNAGTVGAVVSALSAMGNEVWFDSQKIQLSDSIPAAIDQGLKNSAHFVLFYSAQYLESEWCREEMRAIIMTAIGSDSRRVFIVRLDDAELTPLLAHRIYIRHNSVDDTAARIHGAIERLKNGDAPGAVAPPKPGAPERVPIDQFPDEYLPVLAGKLIQISQAPESPVRTTLTTPKGTFEFALNRGLMANEFIFLDLESQLTIFRIASKKAALLQQRLVQGGLGIAEPGFIIELENAQTKQDEVREKLRSAIHALVSEVARGAAG
jgi:hypothetical protein